MTFNLVDEPWILVRRHDGSTDELSMRAVFRQAHDLRRLAGDIGTQDFAVLRVLLAVLYRVLEPARQDVGEDELVGRIWADRSLPLGEIERYLDEWKGRFDLVDPVAPFMQVPDLATQKGETKGLELIVPYAPGDGALFTMRRAVPSLSYAEAARWLIHTQAFDYSGIKSGAVGDERVKGGKGYPLGIGWSGWLGGLVLQGANFFETLLHNYAPPPDTDPRDVPIWEVGQLGAAARPESEIGPFGPMGLFTWPIRRIRLFVSDDLVSAVLVCNGDPIAHWRQRTLEPMSAWRFSEPQTTKHRIPVYMPRAHDPSRELWRGLAALLPAPDGVVPISKKGGYDLTAPADIVGRLGYRISMEIVPDRLVELDAVGVVYGAQMSSYSELFSSSLVLHPSIAAEDSDARGYAVTAVESSDLGVRALAHLAGDLAVASGGDAAGAADRAREQGFAALDHAFRRWLPQLRDDADLDALLAAWSETARRILLAEAERIHAAADRSGNGVRERSGRRYSAGLAFNKFRTDLNAVLPPPTVSVLPDTSSSLERMTP